MSDHRDKRNSTRREVPGYGSEQGVGGRQKGMAPPSGGGEYLDICSNSRTSFEALKKIARDPRLDELSDMGLSRHWTQVAEIIGFDAFLSMWESLDGSGRLEDVGGGFRVYLPRIKLFNQFQRNRLILGLRDKGKNAKEIKIFIKKELREIISERHVARIMSKGYTKKIDAD